MNNKKQKQIAEMNRNQYQKDFTTVRVKKLTVVKLKEKSKLMGVKMWQLVDMLVNR